MRLTARPSTNEIVALLLVALSVGLAFWVRGEVALNTFGELNVDERFYLSAAATGSTELGPYPYVMGFDPIRIYPGNGWVILLYQWAYELLGAHVLSLRIVSYVLGLLAVPAIFLSLNLLYGRKTALLGTAIFPWTFFYVLSNSIRMDAITIAYVAWMMYLVLLAFEKKWGWRGHWLLGLLMALGLQVHLNTAVVTAAFGLLYLSRYIQARKWFNLRDPLVLYVAGYAIGAVFFVIANMGPDPAAFFEILGKIRLWDNELQAVNLNEQEQASSILSTLTSPQILIDREVTRYSQLFADAPLFEFGVGLLAAIAVFFRRTKGDWIVLTMMVGAFIASAIVFINESYFYTMHLLPILFLPIPALIVYGFEREPQPIRLVVVSALVLAFISPNLYQIRVSTGFIAPPEATEEEMPRFIDFVRQIATPEDEIAGPTTYFVEHFADYPRFIGLEGVEQVIGMILYDTDDPIEYWTYKAPDYVFALIFSDEVWAFLDEADYVPLSGNVFAHPSKWFNPPEFDDPPAVFDEQIALLSLSVETQTLTPCETVQVHSWWQTIQADVSSDFSIGIYLMDVEGNIIAQNDGPPRGRVWGVWSPFEFDSDLRTLTVPCEAEAGDYHIGAALYHYNTLERLSVDAEMVQDDAAYLVDVVIE